MAGEDDDAVFFAGELGDDVVHREGAGGGLHVELILLDLRAFKMREDEPLGLGVAGAAQVTGAEGDELLESGKSLLATELDGGRRRGRGIEVLGARIGLLGRGLRGGGIHRSGMRRTAGHGRQRGRHDGGQQKRYYYAAAKLRDHFCSLASARALRCLGCTSQARPMLMMYSPIMGAAKRHRVMTSGVGATAQATTKISRMA